MKKILVSVTNDITTDQRVKKVCDTLHKNGYEIVLIGRQLKDSVPLNRAYKTKRIRLLFNKGFLFFAEFNVRLFFVLFFSKKNMLLSNDLDTLVPNYLVSILQRKKLIYDSHELFPEIPELVHKPLVKKFWTTIEAFIVPKLKNNYTVCNSIATFYEDKYAVSFNTIMNLPTLKETTTCNLPFNTENKKIILYQGAVNIGRGLELMIETMEFLDNHIFVIVGNGDIFESLKKTAATKQLTTKVIFLGKLAPEKLFKITPHAHLGISIEEDLGLNYRFALPNKIFDYIQAKVPILVSNLPEMKQVVIQHNVGEIVKSRKPKELALQITNLLEKDFNDALKNAKENLIWNKQEKKLLAIFKNSM